MNTIKKIFKVILNIILLPYHIVCLTIKGFIQQVKYFIKGFSTLSLFLSRGFYFYHEKIFTFLKNKTHIRLFGKAANYFTIKREEPSHIVLIIVWFITLLFLADSFYNDNKALIEEIPMDDITSQVVKESVEKDETPSDILTTDFNLYRIYNKYSLKDVNINKLKEKNSDTVAWITVEGTNVNYPIVQTDNNDYYLSHSYDRAYTYNGWTFMDFRNNTMLEDKNTIFYGHNLLNGTAFGSLRNIFDNTRSEYKIVVITKNQKKHIYKVFSAYYIDPEIYYLQTNFDSTESYANFLETISSRNIVNVNNSVSVDDKIITLSTCTDDNKGRKVVHAKKVS